jgi:hypothetical protein
MASDIDATKPADNVQVSKQDMRDNWIAAKAEIEALQQKVRLPQRIADGLVSV